jgi:protein-tyrosine phosphatase
VFLPVIDIHSHLIPGIDDGSRSMQQSLKILRTFADVGIDGVVLTPHVTATQMARDPDGAVALRDDAYDPLRRLGLASPRLYLGFEIMLDQPLSPMSIGDKRFSLAGSRYYLVEFQYSVVPSHAQNVLVKMTQAGAVPVVAHPERYEACSPENVGSWRAAGARIQVDSTTLTKPSVRGHRARELLAGGLVDLIAADNHGNHRTLLRGVEYLESRGAAEAVRLLATVNPRAIVNNETMVPVPPIEVKEGMLGRWRRFMAG